MLIDNFSPRANFYRQLTQLEEAGIPIREALKKVRTSNSGLKTLQAHLIDAVNQGQGLGRAFANAPHTEPFERQMVKAASQVGRLSEMWRDLSEYFENKAALRREMISSMTHPLLVLHVAIFAPPLTVLFNQGLLAFAWATLPYFFALWALVIGGPLIAQALKGSLLLDSFCWHTPIIAGVYRANARRTTLAVLRAALAAGVIADEAFSSAADTTPSARMRSELLHASEEARMGLPMPTIIDKLHSLPNEVRDAMASGAEAGLLPETILRQEKLLGEQARMRQAVVNKCLNVGIFLIVAAIVGFKVVTFYQNYANGINDAMK